MGLGTKRSGEFRFGIKSHIYFGFFIRFALIMYGEHHDKTHALKYTDVDYHVFTDAAREVVQGGSPFNRHTYRYTPFLAFLLVPNIVCVQRLYYDILIYEGHSKKRSIMSALMWLYNPLVIGISTRGSADSIAAALILVLLYFLKIRLPVLSGITLGIAIHFKLYPIIYILPIYISFTARPEISSFLPELRYVLYEDQYIDESFLYHFSRVDIKHNFSVYFYLLYLCAENFPTYLSVAAFVPQATLMFVLGLKYSSNRDLAFAMFTQTAAFVTFNKVVTSQYFVWYLVLLPLVSTRLNFSLRKTLFLLSLWLGAQASWLLPAYLLEFHAVNTFVPLWLESIAFFCCNTGILMAFISGYTKSLTAYHQTRKIR
ncbi:GPI mannosyltransferase 1 [Armadillidium vulgare]|nr:GPI mannosyltransferase 1 [Armadillidium vulgare]